MDEPYRPDRLLLQWHLTERCNLRCTHCYQDNYRESGVGMQTWLPVLEQFRAFLAGARPRIRGHITVTGGEPFAHPEFPQLLERLAALPEEFTFAILCNGTMVDAAIARSLANLAPRFVQVSLDGSAATHDSMRGQGTHAAAVAGIQRLVAAGVRTMIAFTAHRGNFREFPDVARLARRLKVARVWADRLIPQGQGAALHGMSIQETQEFIDLMRHTQLQAQASLSNRFGRVTEVALHRALQFLAGGPAYRCTAGDSLITVMPDGTLYPCRRMPISAGNLNHSALPALYDGPLFRQLRNPAVVASGCQECTYERLCRGGLRCLSHAVNNSFATADPGCWLSAASTTASAATAATTAV
jgi:radical SAM protein with 4Fe4S-binding SPASM domain